MYISNLVIQLYVLWLFYTSYLAYDGQNGTLLYKRNGKDNAFEYDFLII